MIYTYLDLSTGHITPETVRKLENIASPRDTSGQMLHLLGWPAMTIAAYKHGFFVTVPDPDEQSLSGLPADLVAVMRHAQRADVMLVRFDSDGAAVADLPSYEDGPYRPELARDDHLLTADELREKYSTACSNGEHPRYLRRDWRHEVASKDTLRGYWDWVMAQLEQEED